MIPTSSDATAGADPVADWLALAIIVAGSVALRLLYIGQPMRYDEAYSYLYFALPSLRTAVCDGGWPGHGR